MKAIAADRRHGGNEDGERGAIFLAIQAVTYNKVEVEILMKIFLSLSLLMIVAMSALRAESNEFLGKVKSLAAQTAGAAASSAATGLNKAAAATQPDQGPAGDLQNSITQLKASIEQSMAAFQKTTLPDSEKLKNFDKALGEFDAALDLLKDGGSYDSMIQVSYTKNKELLDKMKTRANDPSLPASTRQLYEAKLPVFEQAINQTQEGRLIMIKGRNDLIQKRDIIAQNKQVFIDMSSIGDLESANKTLKDVINAEANVSSTIEKLGSGLSQMSSGSGPAKQ